VDVHVAFLSIINIGHALESVKLFSGGIVKKYVRVGDDVELRTIHGAWDKDKWKARKAAAKADIATLKDLLKDLDDIEAPAGSGPGVEHAVAEYNMHQVMQREGVEVRIFAAQADADKMDAV
jgi:hypothetical protein